MQGPTILQLLEQVGSSASSFQVVFLVGAVTFPVGNLLCGLALERVPASLLLSAAMAMLAAAVAAIPMADSLSGLAAASSAAEFALGLLDTGG